MQMIQRNTISWCCFHQEITFSMPAQSCLKTCQAEWWSSGKGYTAPDKPVTSNQLKNKSGKYVPTVNTEYLLLPLQKYIT
jgi:hypothetical protein